MYCVKQITPDMYWVGGSDRRLALFENAYPIPNGIAYNAYVVLDEKTVLLDTVDVSVGEQFFENLEHVLGGRNLDYLIVNHMEGDHCAVMQRVVERYPQVQVVCGAKTRQMIGQFFSFDLEKRLLLVKEKDTLTTGRHTFTFMMAPMVHWPEVMVTYDMTDAILYSADAFGAFGAMNGNLFADEVNFKGEWLKEARRYYANIVGKYGTQVQALLKKAAGLKIKLLCPLHGPVWRSDIGWFVNKYDRWSTYTPEEPGVMIAYASVYGHTQNAAEILSARLADAGVKNITLFDVSVTHPSYILSEAFRVSHIVLASTTYNAGIFVTMENLVRDLAGHNLQNRVVALVENGSWAPTAGALIKATLSGLKNMTFINDMLTIRSALKPDQLDQVDEMVAMLLSTLPKEQAATPGERVEQSALFKLSYGLFVLTAREGRKDNGCIINTVTQVTDSPKRISIAVNKANYTHDMIKRSGVFNVSVLSREAPFALFEHYGFQSGRDVDKFEGAEMPRSENGLCYVEGCTNAFLSGKVIQTIDCGTHSVFLAEVTEAKVLGAAPSMTYAYYFESVKPKPRPKPESKKGFVCRICGYVYEGDVLPPDFICPLCKHGAEDFEPLK